MLEPIQAGISPVTIHPMEYRAMLEVGLAPDSLDAGASQTVREQELLTRIAELEREAERSARSHEAAVHSAREQGLEEGKGMGCGEYAARSQSAAQALDAALSGFAAARDRYLTQVEREVVRLALAIAARVLHREALMDPLMLTGAVRVALGQLTEKTEVRLKVPSTEQSMWEEILRLTPNIPLRPELIADPRLKTGECTLETKLGSVDLGVKCQLAEIERGFFDLLDQREQQNPGLSAQDSGGRLSAIGGQHSQKLGVEPRNQDPWEEGLAISSQRSEEGEDSFASAQALFESPEAR